MADQHLKGVADLRAKLAAMGRLEDGLAIRAASRAAGNLVVKEAKARIAVSKRPHKTYKGHLVNPGFARDSVRMITKMGPSKQSVKASIGVRKEAFYAVQFLERGTSKMRAEPWLLPAFLATVDEQKTAIHDSLQKSVLKAAKGKP